MQIIYFDLNLQRVPILANLELMSILTSAELLTLGYLETE